MPNTIVKATSLHTGGNDLEHFGILGMRWGRRQGPRPGTKSAKKAKKKYSEKEKKDVARKINKGVNIAGIVLGTIGKMAAVEIGSNAAVSAAYGIGEWYVGSALGLMGALAMPALAVGGIVRVAKYATRPDK